MDGHTVHSWEQIRPKGLRKVIKLNLLVSLLLEKGCLACSLGNALGIVPSERPLPIMGVGKGPESLS